MNTYQQLLVEMGIKADSRELERRLAVIIEHLLKLKFVTGQTLHNNARGWRLSVVTQRNELKDHLEEHPALKPKITSQLVDKVYQSVVTDLTKAYPQVQFPVTRQLQITDILESEIASALGQ
jgi:hypothetical protein